MRTNIINGASLPFLRPETKVKLFFCCGPTDYCHVTSYVGDNLWSSKDPVENAATISAEEAIKIVRANSECSPEKFYVHLQEGELPRVEKKEFMTHRSPSGYYVRRNGRLIIKCITPIRESEVEEIVDLLNKGASAASLVSEMKDALQGVSDWFRGFVPPLPAAHVRQKIEAALAKCRQQEAAQ